MQGPVYSRKGTTTNRGRKKVNLDTEIVPVDKLDFEIKGLSGTVEDRRSHICSPDFYERHTEEPHVT